MNTSCIGSFHSTRRLKTNTGCKTFDLKDLVPPMTGWLLQAGTRQNPPVNSEHQHGNFPQAPLALLGVVRLHGSFFQLLLLK